MNLKNTFVVVLLGAITWLPCSVARADESGQWHRFHSFDGSFSIKVQALPQVQTLVYPDRMVTRYAFKTGPVFWLALAHHYQNRQTTDSDESFARKHISKIAEESKSQILWTKTPKNEDATVVRYAMENDEVYQLGQAWVQGDRLFTLAQTSLGDAPAQWDESDRLLNSFQPHSVDLTALYSARETLLQNDAQTLMITGLKYQQEQRWNEAVGVARVLAFVAFEHFGNQSTDTASYVKELGQSLISVSRFDEAEAHLRLATSIYASTKTDTTKQQIDILQNLAMVNQQIGRFDQSKEYLVQASKLAAKQSPPDAATQVAIAYAESKLALISGDPQKALELALLWHQQALTLPKTPAENVVFAKDIDDLQPQYDALMGEIQRARGDFSAARQHLVRAIDGYLKLPQPKLGVGAWKTLSTASKLCLGKLELDQENYTEASHVLSEAVAQLNEDLGTLHPTTLEGLTDLAHCYERLGNFDRARALFQQLLEWRREVFDGPNHAVASTLASMGNLEFRAGNPEQGLRHMNAATAMDLAIPPDQHPQLAAALQGRGNVLLLARQYDAAERIFTKSKRVLEERNVDSPARTVPVMIGLGTALLGQEKYEAAKAELNAALRTAQQALGDDAPQVATALEKLADIDVATDDVAAAVANLNRSRKAMTRFAYGQMADLAELEQLKFLESEFKPALHHATALALNHDQDRFVRGSAPQWLINGKGLSAEALAQTKRMDAGAHRVSSEWVSILQIQKSLADDTALVDLLRLDAVEDDLDARYIAWVTQSKGLPRLVELGDAAEIDLLIDRARSSIHVAPQRIADQGEEDAEKQTRVLLSKLAERLLLPCLAVCDSSPGVLKRIVVSPDSQAWNVPWDALVLKDGRYAVERYSIALVTSGRDLVGGSKAADLVSKAGRSIVVSDPSFGPSNRANIGNGDGGFRLVSRLHQTAAEADAIAPMLTKVSGLAPTDLRRNTASESRIKQVAKPFAVHLATHGFFDSNTSGNPLDHCGLMLANCNVGGSAGEDGVLLGSEIVTLDLSQTRLVVLSACDTGIGQTRGSEGVAGLRHAFHLAGARSVVASLWKANDAETVILMRSFYAALEKAKQTNAPLNVAGALRVAKLNWIAQRRQQNRATHPVFWAAFDATGAVATAAVTARSVLIKETK